MNSRDLQRCVEATSDAESQIKMILETLVTRLDQLRNRRHIIHAIAVNADRSVGITIDVDLEVPPDQEVMASIRRILSEDEDASDLNPRRRCRQLGDDERESALMKEWAAMAGDDKESMLGAGGSPYEAATAVAKDATRVLNPDEIDSLMKEWEAVDRLDTFMEIVCRKYLVHMAFDAKAEKCDEARERMRAFLGFGFTDGWLKLNPLQLAEMIVLIHDVGCYGILWVRREDTIIDISGS